jgi:hypothetical protein
MEGRKEGRIWKEGNTSGRGWSQFPSFHKPSFFTFVLPSCRYLPVLCPMIDPIQRERTARNGNDQVAQFCEIFPYSFGHIVELQCGWEGRKLVGKEGRKEGRIERGREGGEGRKERGRKGREAR